MLLQDLVVIVFLLGGLLVGVSIFWYLRLWERGEEGRWDAPSARPRRLPRLFVIGFALCILSGPLVLWLLITGDALPQLAGAPSGQLERLLAERLPTPELQQQRHDELVRAMGGTAAHGPSTVRLYPRVQLPTGSGWIPAASALLIVLAGLLTWGNLASAWGRLGGLLLSLAGVVVFFAAHPETVTLRTEAPAPPVTSMREIRFEHLGRVGPFLPSRIDAGAPEMGETLLRCRERIEAWAETERLRFVVLIGRTDRQALGLGAREAFGSNAGLAQARANWVRMELLAAGSPVEMGQIVTLAGGPEIVGWQVPDEGLEGDRSVDVYACWAEDRAR